MRKVLLAMTALATLALTPLAASAEPKPRGDITVGLAFDLVNPWGAAYDGAFKKKAEELGIKIVVLDSQGDVPRQSNNIRDLVAQQVDAIVLLPNNKKAVIPAVREAHDAGIPVVLSNGRVDEAGEPYIAAWTGPDHHLTGFLSGELLAEALGDKGRVVILTGTPGTESSIERERGCRDALAKHTGIEVIASQPTDWKREKAQTVTEALISRFGDTIDGVCANDDGISLGALSAINAAAASGRVKDGHIKITSGAAFAEGYETIKKGGSFYGSVLMPPEQDAALALTTAVKLIDGESVPKNQFYETPAFSRANIDQTPIPSF
jgi:ribose transport system substrate-binding protein